MFRHSCGVCHFTNLHRPSDITLADFWGWENNVPEFNNDDKGVSLVLLNTEKGKKIFDAVKPHLYTVEVKTANSLQPNLRHPSIPHPLRKRFEDDYIKYGFKYVMKHYGNTGLKYYMKIGKEKIKRIVKYFF